MQSGIRNTTRTCRILISVLLLITGCQRAGMAGDRPRGLSPADTLRIDSPCALTIRLSESRIRQLKAAYKNEQDFYTVADDEQYYLGTATDFLEGRNTPLIVADDHKILNFGGHYFMRADTVDPWSIILYQKGKQPGVFPAISIKEVYGHYFRTTNPRGGSGYTLPPGYYVLDSALTDLNKDGNTDKLLVLEKEARKGIPNAAHYDLTYVVLKGTGPDRYEQWAQNDGLLKELGDNCPADGYQRLAVKGRFFTIEETSCELMMFAHRYTTFKYDPATGHIVLHQYGEEYTDRSDPNRQVPGIVYTQQQFGTVTFEAVTEPFLTALQNGGQTRQK